MNINIGTYALAGFACALGLYAGNHITPETLTPGIAAMLGVLAFGALVMGDAISTLVATAVERLFDRWAP